MKNGGLKRVLRYFIRYTESYVLTGGVGGVFMAIYLWVLNDEGMAFREYLTAAIPSMILFIAIMILALIGVSAAQYWYVIPISYGCRRRNIFLGNLMMDFLFIAEILVLYEIAAAICKKAGGMDAIPVPIIAALFLFTEGFSRLLGVAVEKWGKYVYVLLVVELMAIAISFGFFIGFGMAAPMSDIFFVSNNRIPWKMLLLLLSIVISAVANGVHYRMISRYEIKV